MNYILHGHDTKPCYFPFLVVHLFHPKTKPDVYTTATGWILLLFFAVIYFMNHACNGTKKRLEENESKQCRGLLTEIQQRARVIATRHPSIIIRKREKKIQRKCVKTRTLCNAMHVTHSSCNANKSQYSFVYLLYDY